MKRPIIAVAAAFGMLAATQPAFAEAIRVEYKDLDLSSEAGQKELDGRINAAARKACGFGEVPVGSRIPSKEARECVANAKKQIEKRVAALADKQVVGS